MKTNLQNDKTLEALSVFRMQCIFYGSQYTAFNSLSKQFKDIVLQSYPGCNKKPIKKESRRNKARYYKECWDETERNAPKLEGIEKRGFKKYDIDHIVPISYGYKNNISPKLIGSFDNLRIISNDENKEKGIRLTEDSIRLLRLWEIQ